MISQLSSHKLYLLKTENTVSGTSPTKRKAFPAYIPSSEPDYIHVAFSPKENSFLMNNPSSDCLKAKGELRSLLKRKQWKLLRAANAEGATNGKSTSSYLLGPVHIVRT